MAKNFLGEYSAAEDLMMGYNKAPAETVKAEVKMKEKTTKAPGTRASKTDKAKKTRRVQLVLTEAEYDKLQSRADANYLSLNAYVEKLIREDK